MTNVEITQTGHSAHDAVDSEGVVLSSHARQDQAIETEVGGMRDRAAAVTTADPDAVKVRDAITGPA